MANPTSLSVSVDRTEYSRYEPSRAVITVTVVSTGGAPHSSEVITVELLKARRDRDEVVATTSVTLSSATSPEISSVEIDLRDVVDPDDESVIFTRRGGYFVRAYAATDEAITADSDDFHVSIVTVERLKSTYLYGLPLGAALSRKIRYQPTNITGVTVETLSEEHPLGFFSLSYNVSSAGVRTLSWGGGPSVTINASGRYLLKAGTVANNSPLAKLTQAQGLQTNFVEVVVSSLAALPATAAVDELLVEKQTLDDEQLRSFLDQACDWLEQVALATYIEPTLVTTETDTTDYDFRVSPITFHPLQTTQWLQIQTPYMHIIRVERLLGDIADIRVLNVDPDWIEHSGAGGMIQLIPYNSAVVGSAAGLLWMGSVNSTMSMPNFWKFDLLVGLKACPSNLQELIAKKAAIDALVLLGQALRPGVGSVSLGRDGVSQSISYTNQAQYGAYTGTITLFKEWIETELKNYKGKYRGPAMVVV